MTYQLEVPPPGEEAPGPGLQQHRPPPHPRELRPLHPPAHALLDRDGSLGPSHVPCPPPGEESPDPPLQRQRGVLLAKVPLPVEESLDVLLDDDAAVAEALSAQLLHVGHLEAIV